MKNSIFFGTLFFALIIVACFGKPPDHLTIRELTLTDDKGNPRIHLSASADTAQVTLYDSKNRQILGLGIREDLPFLTMSERTSGGLIIMTATTEGQLLTFLNPGAKPRIIIQNASNRAELKIGPSRQGRAIVISAMDESGATGLVVEDHSQYRAAIMLPSEGNPHLGLYNAYGTRLWTAP